MKNLLKSLIITAFLFTGIGCDAQQKKEEEKDKKDNAVLVIEPQGFKNEVVGHLLIDVRTPEEYAEGHIKGAINIDFLNENFVDKISEIQNKGTVFIYCRSGGRSGKSTPKFLEAGFTQVVDLKGGIKNWKAQELKVVKE